MNIDNKENLELYLKSLSRSYFLDIMEDVSNEENEYISIPVKLASSKDTVNKFEDSIKHLIYNCYEYKDWIKYFRKKYAPAICCISNNTVTIEVHHHPLTLRDYIQVALSFIYDNNLTYTSNLVADLVIRWHYNNMVSACFLCKTEHKNFHDNHDKVIPEEAIHSSKNLRKFLSNSIVSQYIDMDILAKVSLYMPEFTKNNSDLFKKESNDNNIYQII